MNLNQMITLNIKGLNITVKEQRLFNVGWGSNTQL